MTEIAVIQFAYNMRSSVITEQLNLCLVEVDDSGVLLMDKRRMILVQAGSKEYVADYLNIKAHIQARDFKKLMENVVINGVPYAFLVTPIIPATALGILREEHILSFMGKEGLVLPVTLLDE